LRDHGTHFAGVLGWPLNQTLSPVIHHAAFRTLGLDWAYMRWPVPPDKLADAVRGLSALGADGANVTMPHKERVIDHLDSLASDARAINAVNTIAAVGDELRGHNTDVEGFSRFLIDDAGFDPRGRRALVLGAGGAARAVARALIVGGCEEIAVAARRLERAGEIAHLFGTTSIAWDHASAHLERVDLVVNTTPVGAGGEDLLPDARFHSEQCAVDIVYLPPSTRFVERARADGASAWGGLGMLVRQAAASFRIWTGREAPVETMSAAAVRAIGSTR